jgi:ribosomal protein S18 acetylase RimI-like enzyme
MIPHIRPMTRKDRPAVLRILRDTPEFRPAEVLVAVEVVDGYLNDPAGSGYRVVVAEADSQVVGYLAYGPTPLTEGTWDLYWAAVSRETQGRGTGSALVRHAEDEIRRAQGRLAIIETSSKTDYERARALHRSMGYELAGRIKDFYASNDDKLIFVKKLD